MDGVRGGEADAEGAPVAALPPSPATGPEPRQPARRPPAQQKPYLPPRRFRAEIDAALAEAPADDPLAWFRCFGLAYLCWAMRNPAHFEIISRGRYFDHDKAGELSRDNAERIDTTRRMLAETFERGQLCTPEL